VKSCLIHGSKVFAVVITDAAILFLVKEKRPQDSELATPSRV
jgi:uncharacterized protein (UPF0179 family)